jgi:hypothetical protein
MRGFFQARDVDFVHHTTSCTESARAGSADCGDCAPTFGNAIV